MLSLFANCVEELLCLCADILVSHLVLSLQVGSLTMPPEFNGHFGQFFRAFTEQLSTILPPNTDLPAAYEAGTDDQQAFVQNLALFYTGYFRVSLAAH